MKKRNLILLTTVCLALSACHPASAPSSGSKTSVSEASGSKQEESKDLAADESLSRELYAMDTVMNLTAYGPNASAALEASVSEINRLETPAWTVCYPFPVKRERSTGSMQIKKELFQKM